MIPYQAIILGAVVGIISIAIAVTKGLAWRRSGKKPKPQPDAEKEVKLPKQDKGKEEKKLTWGQQVKRWWLILIFGIPITYFLALGMWGLVCRSVVNIHSSSQAISATYSWKKLSSQYGYDQAQRSSGQLKATITKNDTTHFDFVVHTGQGDCCFFGKKTGGIKKIKGIWFGPNGSADYGGKWELQEDENTKGTYNGLECSSELPEGIPSELIILD